jgi:glycosyltransferase involved in cell wall biosynthesis
MGKDATVRVLYLAKTSSGAPWAVRQVRDHIRLGIEAHVAVPAGGARVPQYAAAGATVHPLAADLPAKRPWQTPARLAEIRELVGRVQPDIIHLYHVGTAVAVRLALGKQHPIPRVFQVPGPLHLEHLLYRRAEIATAGPRDYWVGTCSSICDVYRREGIAPERLFVSDYGVDLEDHVAQPKGKLRAELGVGPERTLVGMVGIMYPPKRYLLQTRSLKGHEDLIDALAIVQRSRPDMLGVFIGGGWNGAAGYEARVRAYGKAKCGDNIAFLGMRSDVPELLPDFDLAVQPSHTEGVAGTAVEAQLLDVPVVATNVGGQPDLIVHGKTGWLVPPKDPPAMAAAILDALADPERTRAIAQAGRERAMTHFNGKKNNADVARIYETILRLEGDARHVPALRETVA